MMRARNLGALVTNLDSSSSGSSRGSRGSAAPAAAEVILHFDLFDQPAPSCSEGVASPAEGGGAASGAHGSGAPAAAAAEQPAPGPASRQRPRGRLLVRRRVTRNGRSDLAIQRLPAPSSGSSREQGTGATNGSEAAAGSSGGGGNGGKGQWQAVVPAALKDLLAPYGIQTEAVDR